jgi:hypothetical protein
MLLIVDSDARQARLDISGKGVMALILVESHGLSLAETGR